MLCLLKEPYSYTLFSSLKTVLSDQTKNYLSLSPVPVYTSFIYRVLSPIHTYTEYIKLNTQLHQPVDDHPVNIENISKIRAACATHLHFNVYKTV